PMAVDHIRYDLLTQQALRAVVRRVLSDVAKSGLPGEHHFYVTFDTRAPGVKLSARMREQYPDEIGGVLLLQLCLLKVREHNFRGSVLRNDITKKEPDPLHVIKHFVD